MGQARRSVVWHKNNWTERHKDHTQRKFLGHTAWKIREKAAAQVRQPEHSQSILRADDEIQFPEKQLLRIELPSILVLFDKDDLSLNAPPRR